MTVTLHLNPELEADLVQKARALGMDVDRYLETLVRQDVHQPSQKNVTQNDSRRGEAVRRMLEFGEKYQLGFGAPVTRESLHEGHRY